MSSINLFPLESIEGFIWLDGKFILWSEAKIHVLTHSLHYSGSVFEGEKSYNGKIFKIEEHTKRLFLSAAQMKLDIPYSSEEIIDASHELLKKNNLQNAYVRPLAWRSTDALMVRPQNPITHLMIAAWEPRKKANVNALNISISRWRKPSADTFPIQCKSSAQYAMFTVAVMEAIEEGFDDALLLDKDGYIAECTTSNIFFTRDNNLITPTTNFCLNGITRQTVIKIANSYGINVIEKNINIDDLEGFDDCFITGTAAGLKSVNSISYTNKKIVYNTSDIFSQLHTEYLKVVKE